MTHFYEFLKNCTDDELIALGKECSYARKYKNFDPDSSCERYMEEIIVGENYTRSSYIVMLDMISAVAYEIMERTVKEDEEPECEEPECEEKKRYYNVSFHVQYFDGRSGFGDCTMHVKDGQKMTPELMKNQIELMRKEMNAQGIVCLAFSPYEE